MNIYADKEKFNIHTEITTRTTAQHRTYVAYNKKYNLYKIGKSKNIPRRVRGLSSLHGDTVLVLVINRDLEVLLHARCRANKAKLNNEKEWFDLSNTQIEWMKLISKIVREHP